MPVLEHEVHEKVRSATGEPYGCSNRGKFRNGYYAPDRDYVKAWPYAEDKKWIPHTMSRTCRYDMSLTDPRCATCVHKGQGEAYSNEVRTKGK